MVQAALLRPRHLGVAGSFPAIDDTESGVGGHSEGRHLSGRRLAADMEWQEPGEGRHRPLECRVTGPFARLAQKYRHIDQSHAKEAPR